MKELNLDLFGEIRSFLLKKLYILSYYCICGALRDLVPMYNFKNVKSTHGGVLILVKL